MVVQFLEGDPTGLIVVRRRLQRRQQAALQTAEGKTALGPQASSSKSGSASISNGCAFEDKKGAEGF